MTETDTPVDAQVVRAWMLPLEQIRPNALPTQAVRRARFTRESLEALADSIAAHGVQQAIVVREVPPAKDGGAKYEIVAGERRFLACKILVERNYAAPHVIPAFIRELDDFQVREIALTENSNREDLHPLEEAQSYEDLLLKPVGGGEFSPPRLKGYTVDELAARVGKSRRFVYGRLDLLKLPEAAKQAMLDGKLQTKIAEMIAGLHGAVQGDALRDVLEGWAGEPFTHRQAVAHLRKKFMLRIADAKFGREDAELVPAAGACTQCPKRTSANPELFDVGSSEDMCLDHGCWESKVKAHADRVIAEAKKAGHQVLTGKEAKKVMPHGESSLLQSGYRMLDKAAEDLTGTKKPLSRLLGSDVAGVTVIKPEHSQTPVAIVKEEDLKKVLQAKGLLKKLPKKVPGQKGTLPTAEEIKATREQRLADMIDSRLPGALWKHMLEGGAKPFAGVPEAWVRWLLDYVGGNTDADDQAMAIAVHGSKVGGNWADLIEGESNAARALAMVMISTQTAQRWMARDTEAGAARLAEGIGFDMRAFLIDIAAEVDAAIDDELDKLKDAAAEAKSATKPAAKKSAPAKVPAKAGGVAIKYRNPETGETWTGRGLQPKWLKVALESGKTLADFDTALTPEKALAAAVEGEKKPTTPQLSDAAAWPFQDITSGDVDPLLEKAAELVRAEKRASISLVQRHLQVGYNRAARLLEDLEKAGVVTVLGADGSRSVVHAEPAKRTARGAAKTAKALAEGAAS